MSNDKMREEFESSPKFRGMDFSRSSTHPQFYESPYANGAWAGWQASREVLVIELPQQSGANLDWNQAIRYCHQDIEAAGVKVKV